MKPLPMPKIPRRRLRRGFAAVALLSVLLVCAVGEWMGWPFLAQPLARVLSSGLERSVRFGPGVSAETASTPRFQVRFFGGIRLTAPQLEIGAPAWSSAPHMLLAQDVVLELRYVDIWRAYRGQPVRIQRLQARSLDGNLERLADGRASWQFRIEPTPPDTPVKPLRLPLFGQLLVNAGELRIHDAPLAT